MIYDSSRPVIHDLDQTPEVVCADTKLKTPNANHKRPSKLFKFIQPRDSQFLSQDSHNHKSSVPRTPNRNCQTKTLSICTWQSVTHLRNSWPSHISRDTTFFSKPWTTFMIHVHTCIIMKWEAKNYQVESLLQSSGQESVMLLIEQSLAKHSYLCVVMGTWGDTSTNFTSLEQQLDRS